MNDVPLSGYEASLEAWRGKTRIAREDVLNALLQHGWTPVAGTSFVQKTFKTAVGEKVASAWLTSGDSFNRTLLGTYRSEGRNVLEPHGQLIPHAARFDVVLDCVSRFSKAVDAVIAETYACRVLSMRERRLLAVREH